MDSEEAKKVADRALKRFDLAGKKFGFNVCPKCGTQHAGKTIACRRCDYRVTLPEEEIRKIKREIP